MKFASFLVFSIFSMPVLAGSVCESDQMNLQINHIEEMAFQRNPTGFPTT